MASSFRTVYALWEIYEVLVQHFDQAKQSYSRDQKEKCIYRYVYRFCVGSCLDVLQELSELSLELQYRNVDSAYDLELLAQQNISCSKNYRE